jgi:NADPH:quinone reductase-like Zn-dependent oxidoreductase
VNIPDRQQAMVMSAPGMPVRSELRSLEAPGPGQVLVRVRASSLNFHDNLNLMGFMPTGPWPRVPMSDGAGEIVASGEGVGSLRVGDRVMGAFYSGWFDGRPTPEAKQELPGDSEDGWLQQYRVTDAAKLIGIPDHLTYQEAATIPCAGVTAWSALKEADVGKGDVVVTLGTGGVSLFVVQFASALGATVILTSSSDEKLKVGSDLGATHLINYRTTPDWEAQVKRLTSGRGADAVVDLGGPSTLPQSVLAAGASGTVVAVSGVIRSDSPTSMQEVMVNNLPFGEMLVNNLRIVAITVGSVRAHRELSEFVADTGLKPHISHVFDWENLDKALETMRAGEHVGKIVLTIP